MDNDNVTKERSVNASGPLGMLRIFKLGSKDNAFGSPSGPEANKQAASKTPTKGAKPAEEKEFKLTLIGYDGKMYANNNLGIAKFWDNVKLIQVPTENPDLTIDVNALPPGYMLLNCGRLEMWEHKLTDGTTTQEMRARPTRFTSRGRFTSRVAMCSIRFRQRANHSGGIVTRNLCTPL